MFHVWQLRIKMLKFVMWVSGVPIFGNKSQTDPSPCTLWVHICQLSVTQNSSLHKIDGTVLLSVQHGYPLDPVWGKARLTAGPPSEHPSCKQQRTGNGERWLWAAVRFDLGISYCPLNPISYFVEGMLNAGVTVDCSSGAADLTTVETEIGMQEQSGTLCR